MSIKFNVFTSNFDFDTTGSTTWLPPVATRALLPSGDPDGAARVVTDEDTVFVYDNGADEWHNTRLSLTQFNVVANAAGITIDSLTTLGVVDYRINLHPADSTNPGGVSIAAQNFAGDKTFDNNVIVTGDLTVNGTQTILNTATVDIEDPNVTYNKNGNDVSSEGSGITIERTGTNASLVHENALASKFKIGALGSEKEIADVSSTQIITNKNLKSDTNLITGASADNLKHETGNQSVITIPDAALADTFVLENETQTVLNKTLDGTSATGTNTITTDADQVTYERIDGSKKNIDAASDETESAISDLDDTIGALDATPTNYTPADPTIVADHLVGIDTTLGNKADTDLNNLIATSVNQSLVPDLNNSKNLGTSATQWNLIYGKFFMSKTAAPYFGSDFNSGFGADFLSGHSNSVSNTGTVTVQSGNQLGSGTGTVGTLNLESGEIFEATNNNVSGVVNVKSGNTVGGGFTGAVNIITGNAATTGAGRSGGIVLQTGTAVGSGVRGSIVFDARNTIFNNRAYPNVANTLDFGQASRSWSVVYANKFEGRVGNTFFKSGDNLGLSTTVQSGDDSGTGIVGDLNLQSGLISNVANVNNTGNINIKTGTTSGSGNRGNIILDADVDDTRLITQPTGGTDLAVATTKYVDDNTSFVIGDLDEVSFGVVNNQITFADVVGVLFNNANTRSAEIEYSVLIDATLDLFESGKIMAIQRGADWVLSQSTNGDISQILFDMTPAGQLQYKSANYAGFVSGTIKCRAITTSV